MAGYINAPRIVESRKPAHADAAPQRTKAAPGQMPAADTLGASLNQSPRSQSLLQLRVSLDRDPRVQVQAGLEHALNTAQKKPNNTGLPDQLKGSIEQLSGLAMDDVRVHYNSAKPAAVQAHAYAQGTDIHVAPGQEQHLPHEAWHVVQQKQGRVKPTLQMKGIAINDDAALEREADAMGARASATAVNAAQRTAKPRPAPNVVVQRGAGDSKAKPVGKGQIGYRMRAPVEGVQLDVTVKTGESKIELVTQEGGKQIDAWLRYEFDKNDKTVMVLNHFEAHPPGIGLGSLLMFELANIAKENGIKTIRLGSAAPTAVGAYEVFGAAAKPEEFNPIFEQQSKKFADKEAHDQFVRTEAKERASQAEEKESFFKPNLKANDLEKIRAAAYDKHVAEHSKHDAARVARLYALAFTMTFLPDVLFEKAWASLEKKWDMHA